MTTCFTYRHYVNLTRVSNAVQPTSFIYAHSRREFMFIGQRYEAISKIPIESSVDKL